MVSVNFKKGLSALIGMMALVSVMAAQSDKQSLRNDANALLDNWHVAAAEANFEAYFGALARDAIFIGTDDEEVWSKMEFAEFSKPYFERGKAWDFKPLRRNIYFSSDHDVIWFDELLNTWMGLCRGSGVLEKQDGEWKIMHYVLSVTVPNEDVGPVIEAKFATDSSRIVKYGGEVQIRRVKN